MLNDHNYGVNVEFINRSKEISRIKGSKSRLIVLFGRRRVGKTALIQEIRKHLGDNQELYYSQAIEGAEALQVSQTQQDIAPLLPEIQVNNWVEFFRLLRLVREPGILVFDEFPYLVRAQASLPSIMQKFIDHDCPDNLQIMILGSSQNMMHSLFLSSHSPLYERADDIIHIRPMSYLHFCEAKGIEPSEKESFTRFSLVGGIPKYWEYLDTAASLIDSVESLYFESGARLESEPERLMKDENLTGEQAKSLLELVGRGVHRPSEMASRLGIKQTSLSKPLESLIHASLLTREIPFGESLRTTKRTLYTISDPVLSFWYSVYSSHRSIWWRFNPEQKIKLIQDQASHVFESEIRNLYPDGQRYWEADLEFDCVRYADGSGKNIIISELKYRNLGNAERKTLLADLETKFKRSKLSKNYHADFEVLDIDQGLHRLAVYGTHA